MVGADIISDLAGIQPGSALAALRTQRAETTAYAQGSYLALLEPDDPGGVSRIERAAIALRVAMFERSTTAAHHYRGLLITLGASSTDIARIEGQGPSPGNTRRLDAVLRHAHLLTNAPRDASPDSLAALRDAGLSSQDIVTVSQVIAFVSYQIRMIALLQAMEKGK